ncbi:MAG TPA: redoxin domain-containing protein [Candidatus Eisenbacteria bacterium]
MKISTVLLVTLLAALFVIGPGEVMDPTPPPTDGAKTSLRPKPPEPPSSEVEPGDLAPDFAYQGDDNRWRRLHDLLAQGPVVLIFGATPPTLVALERERDAILRLGANPVAVVDMRGRTAWAQARKLGLRYLVIPDSRRVIASQFNTVDASGQTTAPAWFVLDRGGRVRGLRRGTLPAEGFTSLVAKALGVPDPGGTIPAGLR